MAIAINLKVKFLQALVSYIPQACKYGRQYSRRYNGYYMNIRISSIEHPYAKELISLLKGEIVEYQGITYRITNSWADQSNYFIVLFEQSALNK